jgi:FlaG/FlaF family flagellin (archaellin)
MKRFMRNKRGVSTVISTILMIMVAMIGMSVLFGYVVFYTDNYKAGAGSSVLEHLTIEDVWVKDSHTVWITVSNPSTRVNLGADVDLTVSNIYVDGMALRSSGSSITFNQVVKAGGPAVVLKATSVQMQSLNTPGHIYSLKIVTLRSSSFESQFTN